MTARNRLAKSELQTMPKTQQEWVERGNRLLAGTEPTTKGEYLKPRTDVHWVLRDGRCVIEWKISAKTT